MHITTLEEYGIRCALQLARFQKNKDSLAVKSSQIAELEGLSIDYVAKIMQLFRKKGLVSSVRGHQGGFILTQSPKEVSLKAVMECLQTKKYDEDEFCGSFTGLNDECVHECNCPLRPVWKMLFKYFDEVLKAVTLNDLLVKEEEAERFIQTLGLKKCKEVINHIKGAENT